MSSSSQQQWASSPPTTVESARMKASSCPTPFESVHHTAATPLPGESTKFSHTYKCSVDSTVRKEMAADNEITEKLESEHPVPTKEDIGEILSFLQDGAPPGTSDSVYDSQRVAQRKTDKVTKNAICDINLPVDLDVQIDDRLAEEVKEFVMSCGYSSLQHGIRSSQHDQVLEEWLSLELIDDIDTDLKVGDENATEHYPLLAHPDCLSMKQSLNEVNNPLCLDHTVNSDVFTCTAHKTTTSTGRKNYCFTDDELLEPADDWNQWNEPAYVERIINPVSYTHLTLPTIYSV